MSHSVPMRVFTDGNIVFKWGPSANDPREYDTHIQIYTKRHLDLCAVNGGRPWPFEEIRIKARNADTGNDEYIIGDTIGDFAVFCNKWGDNPREITQWARIQIADRERKNSSPLVPTGYIPRQLDA